MMTDEQMKDEAALAVSFGSDFLTRLAEEGTISETWFNEIDLGILDMQSSNDCILGQIFWDRTNCSGFTYATTEIIRSGASVIRMGFDIPIFTGVNMYSFLGEAWTEEIIRLRENL